MKIPLLSFCVLVSSFAALAGEPIVTTIIARGVVWTNAADGRLFSAGVTNAVIIPNGQAARVSMLRDSSEGNVWVEKSGLQWGIERGEVIQGPARFVVRSHRGLGEWDANNQIVSMLTVERWAVRKATPAELAQ
jgi:hypothetical protein